MPAFTMFLTEICPPEYIGIGYGVTKFITLCISIGVPMIFTNTAENSTYVYGAGLFALFCLIDFIFCAFYLIETKGLQKKEIYLKMRGKNISKVQDKRQDEKTQCETPEEKQ